MWINIDMCMDMSVHVYRRAHRHVYGHVYRRVHRHAYGHVYRHVISLVRKAALVHMTAVSIPTLVCTHMHMDSCTHTRIDTHIDTCKDTCIDTCIDMCMDMRIDM